ncbi:acyl-CoA synthetase (AMP-forming)/AMP-acid ligase II [Maritalea mobilis]|uniref:Acyl-CoA synthetase (AMP-forming)/AMP-acid ligase II n=1 Tax=Maritalea mobilis TaxID=483324 RepID=A0A4R6VK89_9HYPH|nr:AMP-binding protein [Maritalea mobilis]TDQ62028.1 acyl-CoA synthetase (AMP-forming)/AMP-acid ligase II [Maritalea mobilis]
MSSEIVSRIKHHLSSDPARPTMFAGQEVLTASALLAQIEAAEARLRDEGALAQIALALPTSVEALVLFIAALKVARNTIYFDPNWPAETKQRILNFVQPDLLIDQVGWTSLPGGEAPEGDAHYTCFTSGSTGLPKGCLRHESSWLASFEADQPFSDITAQSTILVAGSFAHSLFTYAAIRGLVAGASIVLLPNFHPGALLRQIERHHQAVLFAVPTQLDALVSAAKGAYPHLRKVLCTGSKLAPHLAAKVKEHFPKADLIEFYGTSELSYVAARPVQQDDAAGLVGKPLDPVQIEVLNEEGLPVLPGETGQVFVQSPLAFKTYLTEAGQRDMPDRISVGDTGFVDAKGNLHLVGRADRMFTVSGRNVAPEEIEAALHKLPYVAHAAVWGKEDAKRGHQIVAVLHLKSAPSRAQILSDLRPHLTPYLMPQYLFAVADWPHTSSGKTDLQKLNIQWQANQLQELT